MWEQSVFNQPALSIGAKYSCCGQINLPANMHLYCFRSDSSAHFHHYPACLSSFYLHPVFSLSLPLILSSLSSPTSSVSHCKHVFFWSPGSDIVLFFDRCVSAFIFLNHMLCFHTPHFTTSCIIKQTNH